MNARWDAFVAAPAPGDHAAEVYSEPEELADSLARFLAAGFAAGSPAVVAATAAHRVLFEQRLAVEAWSWRELERDGVLVTADAQELAAEIVRDGRPDPEAFAAAIGGLVDRAAAAAAGRPVRVFGELVDVLVRGGDGDAALELERLWEGLVRDRGLALLCGYRLDVFDRTVQTDLLPPICRAHSHVLPAHDSVALDWAVRRALDDIVGPARRRDILYIVGDRLHGERVPVAQDALRWISANLPDAADQVLASAREHYGSLRGATVA